MKQTLIIFNLLISTLTFSQPYINNAYIITSSDDTIIAKVDVFANLFDKTLIEETSFNNKLRLVTDEGIKTIKAKDLKYLTFMDFKGYQRVFITNLIKPVLKIEGKLIEEMINGNLSWYRDYYPHPTSRYVMHRDYFILKGGEPVSPKLFSGRKKILKELTKDFPELTQQIDSIYDDVDVLNVIRKYNKL